MDTLLHGRFRLEATWAAVVAAILLGFVNSFVRPLHRARSKPLRAALVVVLTVLVNAILLQIFVWVGADVSTQGFIWVLVAAAFVTLLAGLINWLVGFNRTERPRPFIREKPAPGSREPTGASRPAAEPRDRRYLGQHRHLMPVRLDEKPEIVRAGGNQLGVGKRDQVLLRRGPEGSGRTSACRRNRLLSWRS